MLQFRKSEERTLTSFKYKDSRPDASTNDLCGQGQCRKKLQQSLDRGFFYVYADKKGTVRNSAGKECTAANYFPAWTEERFTYEVLGAWPEKLWKQYKVSTAVYEDLLFKSRDGVPSRKRNLDLCREHDEQVATRQAIDERTTRIRSNPEIYRPFPEVPAAKEWLELFKKDALRYPILVVFGQEGWHHLVVHPSPEPRSEPY
jgi:hypothetical protein